MPVLMVLEIPGATIEQYEKANELMGIRGDEDAPEGLIEHIAAFDGNAMFALDVSIEPAQTTTGINRTVPLGAIDWPNVRSNPMPTERWYARDVTPAVRIRQAFAQFMPGEGRKPLHYSTAEASARDFE